MLYVVDQNMVRGDHFCEVIHSEPTSRFVIPEVAFEEMVKHEHWEDTMRRSFAVFAPILDRTYCSAPTGELISFEAHVRLPVSRERLLPDEITDCARVTIEAVVTGGERLGEVRQRVAA